MEDRISPNKWRRVRVRSALSDSQLVALRSCYSRTPRPDAAAKLWLAQHTGLSPQVVRVWFQNKRCKDKRNQDKRARRLAEELSYANYRQRSAARLMVVHSPDPPASAVPITVHESPWQPDGLFDPWIDDEDFLFTESIPNLRASDPLGGEGPGGEGPGGGDDDDSLTFLSM